MTDFSEKAKTLRLPKVFPPVGCLSPSVVLLIFVPVCLLVLFLMYAPVLMWGYVIIKYFIEHPDKLN